MRSAVRVAIGIWLTGLALGPAAVAAQEAPPPSTPTPHSIGPKALQNFSLQGNVTRPADGPAEPPPRKAATTASEPPGSTAPKPERRPATEVRKAARASDATPRPAPSAGSPPLVAPITNTTPAPTSPPPAAPSFAPAPEGSLAPEHSLLVWPWILALIALGAGCALLLWRKRSHRLALAGGPQLDLFAAPEPAPAPAPPRPAPPPRAPEPIAPPTPRGIVSTSLRPQLEVDVRPQRCIVTEEAVTIEFELDLHNAGNAPARAVHLAAALINASDAQDRELAEFFAREAGPGERIDAIQPLKGLSFPTQLAVPIGQVRVLEISGRRVFVPLLAINVHYEWGGKVGRTSVSYMVGREGKTGKLAPFRLDLGPRIFRGLGARLLPGGVRS